MRARIVNVAVCACDQLATCCWLRGYSYLAVLLPKIRQVTFLHVE